MRMVGLVSLLLGSALLASGCGDSDTLDTDAGVDASVDSGPRDGGDAQVVDAMVMVDAAPRSFTAPALVDSDDTSSAVRPHIAVNGAGNALAVWYASCATAGGDTTCTDVWASRFASGTWAAAQKIDTQTGDAPASGSTDFPDVAIDAAGNGAAVWTQSDGTRNRVWGSRFSMATSSWSTAQALDNGVIEAGSVRVAAGNGTAVAVWDQALAAGVVARRDVWSARHDGTNWGAPALIETHDVNRAVEPVVGMDSTGAAVAVWRQLRTATSPLLNFGYDIAANRMTSAGVWGTAQLIENDDAAGENGGGVGQDISVRANGDAVVVWHDFNASPSISDIKSNRLIGGVWGTALRIENSTVLAYDPRVAIDSAGTALAVWQVETQPNVSIVGNRMTAAGTWGNSLQLEALSGDSASLNVAGGGNGIGAAVWRQIVSSDNDHIWAVVGSNGSNFPAPVQVENQGGEASEADVGIDGNGVAHVIWTTTLSGRTTADVFSARLNP